MLYPTPNSTPSQLTAISVVDAPHVAMFASEYVYHRVGGLGTHVRALAPRLADRTPVELFVPRYGGGGADDQPMGQYGEVHRGDALQPQPGWNYDRQVWEMNDVLNHRITRLIESGKRYDLIHSHDWLTGYVANDLHRRYGLPVVVTLHATEYGRTNGNVDASPLSQRIHMAEKHLAHEANRVIACSQFMRHEIADKLVVSPEKIIVIPNGVELERFLPLIEKRQEWAAMRWRWAAPGAPLIFYVGRLVWGKRLGSYRGGHGGCDQGVSPGVSDHCWHRANGGGSSP